MDAVNAVSDIHHLGEYVTGQNEGRKDQPLTGNDLYNFAVQTDSNFMTVCGDIRNMGTVMNSEFKGVDNEFKLVRMEMASGFAAVEAKFQGVDAEFKVVRAELKEGFARLRIEIQRSNWRVSVSTIGAMIALFGIDRFWL